MPSYASEAALVNAAQRRIRARGDAIVRKVHQAGYGVTGEPDLDACIRGRSVKLEAKQPGKRPTDAQFKRMREWQAVGALVGWFTSTEELDAILAHLDDPVPWQNPQLQAAHGRSVPVVVVGATVQSAG